MQMLVRYALDAMTQTPCAMRGYYLPSGSFHAVEARRVFPSADVFDSTAAARFAAVHQTTAMSRKDRDGAQALSEAGVGV